MCRGFTDQRMAGVTNKEISIMTRNRQRKRETKSPPLQKKKKKNQQQQRQKSKLNNQKLIGKSKKTENGDLSSSFILLSYTQYNRALHYIKLTLSVHTEKYL